MKKTLLALAGALLLLAVVLFVTDQRAKAAARPQYAFETPDPAAVTALSIAYQADSVALELIDGRWVNAADSFPTDTARLGRVLDRVLTVQDRERAAASPDSARLAEYGLDASEAKRVSWTLRDGTRYEILLGKTSGADYSSTYWKHPGESAVYTTPGSFTHEVATRAADWRDRNLFPYFVYEDVKAVEVEWVDPAGQRINYRLERGPRDSGYVMTAPQRTPVPAPNAVKVFEQTPQFVIDAFVDSDDPYAMLADVDSAFLMVRTTMKNGAVYELKAGREFEGSHYARHPYHPRSLVRILKWRVDFFKKTPEQLLAPPPADVQLESESFLNPSTATETQEPAAHGPGDGHGH